MRFIITLIVCVLCLSSCKDKVICPAFQSTYILDDSVRSVYYSYLWKLDPAERDKYLAGLNVTVPADSIDSTAISGPIIASAAPTDYFAYLAPYKVTEREVKKNKYGMLRYEPYWLASYRQKTAPMENILAPPPPPLIEPADTVKDVGEFVASDFSDTLDSVSLIATAETDTLEMDSLDIPSFPDIVKAAPTKQKLETQYLYRYDPNDKQLNAEQAYYNKYFGQYLYRKVPVVEPTSGQENSENSKGWLQRFFQNLFKKTEKTPQDQTPLPAVESESPPVEEVIEQVNPDDGF